MNRRHLVIGSLHSAIRLRAIAQLLSLTSLALAPVEAAVLLTTTQVANPPTIPFAAPEASLGAPWVSYRLGLEATSGELIGAVSLRINAPLHQRWTDSDEDGIYEPSANSLNSTNGDSHLTAPAGAVFGTGPAEDNSGIGSPLPDTSTRDYGVGTFLRGAWGIPNPTTSTNLAYIVIPSGSEPLVEILVQAATPQGDLIEVNCGYIGLCTHGRNLRVSGNGTIIADGDNTPRTLDNTDFGTVLAGSLQQRTFTISSTGIGAVDLGSPTLTGPFSLVGAFPSGLGEIESATFSVQLDTSAVGTYSGSISFATNVPGRNPFNFSLAANVIPEPATASLCGMAIGGLVLIKRRRKGAIIQGGRVICTYRFRVARALTATAVLLTLATSPAEAAVIGTATLIKDPANGVPFAVPDQALGAPWVSYVLGLHSTAGELVAAIDASITGPLHQRWNDSDDDGVFEPTANSANQSNGDSHFTFPGGQVFFFGPSEDNSGVGSPLPDTATRDYGVGTFLDGAWGLAPVTTSIDFAYLVIPRGREGEVQFRIKAADPQGNIIADLSSCNYFFTCVDGPIIDVSGNGVSIPDGDLTPSLFDNTDFGTVTAGSVSERTFTINVSGVGPLLLQPPVFTGPYSLIGAFPMLIDSGSSADFTVALDTNAGLGSHPGSISFGNDSLNAFPTFEFALQARIVPEPACMVLIGIALGASPGRHCFRRSQTR